MGSVLPGPPRELVQVLKRDFSIRYFVETGTFLGDTAEWASTLFEKVFTVEASPELFRKAKARFSERNNIEVIFGDSKRVLREIVHSLDDSAVFWLDAHWSAGITAGQGDECPILDEIKATAESSHASFLFIDDARFFMSPPHPPHDWRQWPTIDELLRVVHRGREDSYLVVFQDIIIAVPVAARETVVAYCRGHRSEGQASVCTDGLRRGGRLLILPYFVVRGAWSLISKWMRAFR